MIMKGDIVVFEVGGPADEQARGSEVRHGLTVGIIHNYPYRIGLLYLL